jgi:hypothetical protein
MAKRSTGRMIDGFGRRAGFVVLSHGTISDVRTAVNLIDGSPSPSACPLDAFVFTAGIGENSPVIRERIVRMAGRKARSGREGVGLLADSFAVAQTCRSCAARRGSSER